MTYTQIRSSTAISENWAWLKLLKIISKKIKFRICNSINRDTRGQDLGWYFDQIISVETINSHNCWKFQIIQELKEAHALILYIGV